MLKRFVNTSEEAQTGRIPKTPTGSSHINPNGEKITTPRREPEMQNIGSVIPRSAKPNSTYGGQATEPTTSSVTMMTLQVSSRGMSVQN